jgi:kumamolisin
MLGVLAVALVVTALVPAVARARQGHSASGASGATHASAGRVLGPTPARERVEFDLVLTFPHEGELDAFLDRVNDPSSPDYHRFATAAQIGERFGISDGALAHVHDWIAASGLEIIESFPQRTTVRVAGAAGTVNHLFGVRLMDRVDPETHRRYHAPRGDATVPREVAADVEAVAGLNTRPFRQPAAHMVPRASTTACQRDAACYTPERLARTFDIARLHQRGLQGENQYVAVIMSGTVTDGDLDQWEETVGLDGIPPIERITVGEGPSKEEASNDSAVAEGTMDVQTVQAVAPRATVLYYFASLVAFGDAVNAVVRDGRARVATYSAGGCDEMWLADKDARALRMSDARAVKAAVAAGVNVLASSGDNGAYACSRFDLDDWRATGANPSDFPYVLSVGGTYVERAADGTYVDEAAWEWPLTNIGTGGGLNPLDARPTWQRGPGVQNRSSNGKRQFPDVSAPADPLTGWYIVVGGEGQSAGGTSASSPFWAGLLALYEQMAEGAGLSGLGFITPTLYAVAAASPANTLFHDVVRGGNMFYEATPGWDYATGIGTPIATPLGDAIVAYLRANPSTT